MNCATTTSSASPCPHCAHSNTQHSQKSTPISPQHAASSLGHQRKYSWPFQSFRSACKNWVTPLGCHQTTTLQQNGRHHTGAANTCTKLADEPVLSPTPKQTGWMPVQLDHPRQESSLLERWTLDLTSKWLGATSSGQDIGQTAWAWKPPTWPMNNGNGALVAPQISMESTSTTTSEKDTQQTGLKSWRTNATCTWMKGPRVCSTFWLNFSFSVTHYVQWVIACVFLFSLQTNC